MEKLDYKKAFKELYSPKTIPSAIEVPEMKFIQVDGRGDPNEPDGDYQKAIELLYALTFTIKMSPKSGVALDGYFEYVVPPLEGLWWLADDSEPDFADKSKYFWTSMIRQPEFVTDEIFEYAVQTTRVKKPHIDVSKARFVTFTEGLCVQCMHIGSYDDEPATIAQMKDYMEKNGFAPDLSAARRHHEIYLSDPRRVEASRRKTVLRYPVKKL